MAGSRFALVLLSFLTAILAVAAVWLMMHNPSIDGTSRGDDYSCLAPYDTVLNDADNIPGGETPPDSDEIGERCRDLGHDKFDQGLASGSVAAVLAVLTTVTAVRRRHAG